jgi:hypothetical protein
LLGCIEAEAVVAVFAFAKLILPCTKVLDFFEAFETSFREMKRNLPLRFS